MSFYKGIEYDEFDEQHFKNQFNKSFNEGSNLEIYFYFDNKISQILYSCDTPKINQFIKEINNKLNIIKQQFSEEENNHPKIKELEKWGFH